MKALIIPTFSETEIYPLMSWFPEYLIPVANKPIAAHNIELLLKHGIKDIIFVIKHRPYETELYLGNGERWGVHISYSLESKIESFSKILQHISSKLNDEIIVIPSNMITNINISQLSKSHNESGADFTLGQPVANIGSFSKKNDYTLQDYNCPFILSEKALNLLIHEPETKGLDNIINKLRLSDLKINSYDSECDIKKIKSIEDYWILNKEIMDGSLKSINISEWENDKGIFVGRKTNIDPSALIDASVIIGNNCKIGKNVNLKKNSIIGDNVIIDANTTIDNSYIMSDTYVGEHTEVKNSLVRKNNLFNLDRKINTFINEDFILADIQKRIFSSKIDNLISIVFAILLLGIFSPILILIIAYNKISPKQKILNSKKQLCEVKINDLEGNYEFKYTKLYYINSKILFLRKLPGLINVLKGEINLIGIYPPEIDRDTDHNEFRLIKNDLNKIGLFTLFELETSDNITEEQKFAINNYYNAKRSPWLNISIILRSFKTKGIY